MNDETLDEAVQWAHSRPHVHRINGREVGHHRLLAMARPSRVRYVDATCGLESEHPSHLWSELFGAAFRCPGVAQDEARRIYEENAAHGLGDEVTDRWVLVGRMDEARREDGGTHAYTVMESFAPEGVTEQWVMVSSEGTDHQLVDALAGKVVRVTIEIIGDVEEDRP